MASTPGDSSAVPPEKSIILKGWEKLDDDVIIKEVSTKGKHVNLCIQYLAERNELSMKEAKNYFLQKVNAYVYRLLSNRQLYKAHHILKNIDRVPRYVFYQIAAETTDHGLRDYIREHLARTVENYSHGEEERIAASWRVYTQLKANVRQMAEVLNEVTTGYTVLEIETMSFNTFCMKEDVYRNSVAVDLFFKNQETEISPILDRYTVWSYLLKNNIANLVKIWIQLNSCLRRCFHDGTDPAQQLLRIKIDIYDDPRFNERLRQLFQRWEIDDFMLSQLSHHRTLSRNDILLNELARLGKFLDHERNDAVAIVRRLFTTESFKQHREWTEAKWFREQLTRQMVDNRFFTMLGLPIVCREMLERIGTDPGAQHHDEVKVFRQLQKLKNSAITSKELLGVSRTTSEYILKHNRAFYEENPIVYLFEYGLDERNTSFAVDDPCFAKLPHLQNFIARTKAGFGANETSGVIVSKLLAIAGVPDAAKVQQFLFHGTRTDANGAVEEEDERASQLELLEQHGTVPHFNHPLLVSRYGQPVTLRYMHFIRLHRACHAVYEFYREQLQNYSQISSRQLNSAAQTVARMAIERYWDKELATHAVAFIEMIGVSSVPTRAYLRCLSLVGEASREGEDHTPIRLSVAHLLRRCEEAIGDKSIDDPELLVDLEAMTIVAKTNALPYPEVYLRERLLARNDWLRFLLLVDYLSYPAEQIVELCRTGFHESRIGRNLMTALLHQPRPIADGRDGQTSSSSFTSCKRRSSLTPRRRRRASSTTVDSSGHSSISSETDATSIGRSTSGIGHTITTTSSPPLQLPATDISTSSSCSLYDGACFLSERYDTDLVSVLLLCSNEANPYAAAAGASPPPFDFETFKRLTLQATSDRPAPRYPYTYQNLLDRAIRSRWPLLALLAGDVCAEGSESRRYCWIVWAMLAGEFPFQDKLSPERTEPPGSEPERSFVCGLVEHLVQTGRLCTLASSLATFYPDSGWYYLAAYLSLTEDVLFDADRAAELLTGFLVRSATAGDECFLLHIPKYEMFAFCARLLMVHLDRRTSMHHQFLLLQSYVRCDFRCFLVPGIDFERMLRICGIVRHCGVTIDFLALHECSGGGGKEQQLSLYESLCEQLVARKHHEAAIAVAEEAGLPRESIIFEHWVSGFESSGSVGSFERYRAESERYGLEPELRISFFTHIANRLEYGDRQRYDLLRYALELIREHGLYPSEAFDRDRLEYELALSYIRCTDERQELLELYCSQYWCNTQQHHSPSTAAILYHTFLELKEVAGIDDLTLSNVPLAQTEERLRLDALINRLLDCGDIVQALRYQAIFEQRPLDLHFIVFCMALAEGLVSLYNLSKEERMLLNEDSARSSGRFQRRTLRFSRVSQSSQIGGSPMKSAQLDTSDTSTTATSDFEEVPSRDRQDIFEAISALGNRITHGQELAQRVVLTYRVAMYLDREYNELLKLRDPLAFLPEVVREDCVHKLEVISDIVTATRMSIESFTDFLASEIVSAVVRSKFYLFQQQLPQTTHASDELLWGYNIDREFHLFLELAPNTTALGNVLLRYCNAFRLYRKRRDTTADSAGVRDALESFATIPAIRLSTAGPDVGERLDQILQGQILSLKKQNTIIVALLVKAHDCFVHECSMEGIMEVLACCKALTVILTAAKSWNLIVKLLVGIGRYRDMYYCFETLISHEQFESLLGQFDDRASNGRRLQSAIITFLNEHCPERRDYFRLAALHFRMYREIAELWETEAHNTIDAIVKTYEMKQPVATKSNSPAHCHRLQVTALVQTELTGAMDAFTHATENYLLDNNLTLAQRAAANAELVALQICYVRQALVASEKGQQADSSPSTSSSASKQVSSTCLSVLNLRPPTDDNRRGGAAAMQEISGTNAATGTLLYYINFLLAVPQALIVGRAYGIEINWPGAIYQHYIIQGEATYLVDYLDRLPLTDGMIETLVKLFQLEPNLTPRMEQAIGTFIDRIQSVTLKYRLSSLLGLKKTIHGLINGGAVYYLKDTNYGKNDVESSGGGGSGGSSGNSTVSSLVGGSAGVTGAAVTAAASMTGSLVGSASITSNTVSLHTMSSS
ncbi:uncharacterized protein LOC118513203 [Anopheles stephensi]|uniref:uncharacterized protein LOC118513203 n=1 Tax=Anopheles stephensi TaxID=30069 RepID=UPI001658738D|nr:uncharacterized protein LOC118513203 [Anopheles stephensi]